MSYGSGQRTGNNYAIPYDQGHIEPPKAARGYVHVTRVDIEILIVTKNG